MTRPGGESGWTKPAIIVAILSFVANLGWAWVGIQRDDTRAVQDALNRHETRLAVMQSVIDQGRARRDEQVHEIEARLDRLERRR